MERVEDAHVKTTTANLQVIAPVTGLDPRLYRWAYLGGFIAVARFTGLSSEAG